MQNRVPSGYDCKRFCIRYALHNVQQLPPGNVVDARDSANGTGYACYGATVTSKPTVTLQHAVTLTWIFQSTFQSTQQKEVARPSPQKPLCVNTKGIPSRPNR